jgi:hypothetical protein
LFFFLSLVFIFIGIFLSGWMVYARWINPQFGSSAIYLAFEPVFIVSLVVFVALSIVAFVMPMRSVHRLMAEHARRATVKVGALAETIAELEDSLLSRSRSLAGEELQSESARLQALRNVYSQRRYIDLRTFTKFVGVQVPAWMGLVISVASLVEKTQELRARFHV